jgi:Meiotically Up-regulated Gene 113 (MUG113) protein
MHIVASSRTAYEPPIINDTFGSVYLISAEGSPLYKIGFTKKPLAQLLKSLQRGCPLLLKVLASFQTATPWYDERNLHHRYERYRQFVGTAQEWFRLPPAEVILLVDEFSRRNSA